MDKTPDTAGVIAPPPLVFAGCLLLGLALDELAGYPGLSIPRVLRWLIALLATGAAAYLLVKALRLLRRSGTPVEPWKPTSALATSCVYGRSRNPIYLAMALLHAAIALALDAIFCLFALAPAILAIRYGVIDREERYLLARFGEPYRRYRETVRRWL